MSSDSVYDATGKESSGLLMGDLTQQGNYDECLNLRQYHSLELTLGARYHGAQFCSAYFNIPDWMTDFVKTLVSLKHKEVALNKRTHTNTQLFVLSRRV